MKKRIAYDSITLFACLHEIRKFIGFRVQKFSQIEEQTLAMELFNGKVGWIIFGWGAESFRLHQAIRPQANLPRGPLCKELFTILNEAVLISVEQMGCDRIARIKFEAQNGREYRLVLELMGKHSNFMIIDESNLVHVAGKFLGAKQTRRPVLPMQKYLPAFEQSNLNLWNAQNDELTTAEGCSPYIKELLAEGLDWDQAKSNLKAIKTEDFPAQISIRGVHPLNQDQDATQSQSIGLALQKLYEDRYNRSEFDQLQRLLRTQLERAILARETSLYGLIEAENTAHQAPQLQLYGELILAYQGMVKEGDKELDAFDYEGNSVQIPLDSELSTKENAQKLFVKAKKAKNRLSEVEGQKERISNDLANLKVTHSQVTNAISRDDLVMAQKVAQAERWLVIQTVYSKDLSERPFEGHSIKIHHAPKGYEVLVGENAESNDYLTIRVAKPGDWWLHVRGGPSAHVIIRTNGKPESTPKEVLEFAAIIVVKNSPQKHGTYVPVDYTQKRYVRRMKGGKPGLVHYTHEKTLHVSGL